MAYSTVWLSANVTGAPLAAYVALVLATTRTHCVENPTFTQQNVTKTRARYTARGVPVTFADSHTVQ